MQENFKVVKKCFDVYNPTHNKVIDINLTLEEANGYIYIFDFGSILVVEKMTSAEIEHYRLFN